MSKLVELWSNFTCAGQLTPTDRRNQWVAVGWLFAWMTVFVFTLHVLGQEPGPAAAWTAIVATTILGGCAVIAFRKFLVEADEMQRKIQYEGLAVGFGVGLVAGMTFQLLERLGVGEFDPSSAVTPMMVAYSVAILVSSRRLS